MKIASAFLLLTSISSSNAAASFLRAPISNDDGDGALRCLGYCADESIYTDGKKHVTRNKVYSKATDCASDCLPTTQRNAETISCTTRCFRRQASSVEKAIERAIDKEIKKCERDCDDDDKGCERQCERKYRSGSRDKRVNKAVERKAFKVADSTKKCLAKCIMPSDDVDFMMESMNNENLEVEDSSRNGDDSSSSSSSASSSSSSSTSNDRRVRRCVDEYRNQARCVEDNKCVWNSNSEQCQVKQKKTDFDFQKVVTASA